MVANDVCKVRMKGGVGAYELVGRFLSDFPFHILSLLFV